MIGDNKNNVFSGNNIKNTTYGIYLTGTSNNTKISSNKIENNSFGILLNDSNNTIISGNTIANNKDKGISLCGSNNTIIKNKITNNKYYGIYLQDTYRCKITNNNITNNNQTGIYLDGYSSKNTISGNNITNNKWYGIHLYNSSNNTISNNNIKNNTYGIYLYWYSSNNTIYNNNITNNGNDGIGLYDSSNNTIYNNNITNNKYGIDISDSEYNKIYNNNITNNKYGIDISDSEYNTIYNNTIKNNGNDGIYLSDSEYNKIYNNNITNNKYGILLGESSNNNRVYRNSFIGNGVQAQVDSGTGNLFNLAKPTGGNYWSDYTGKDLDGDGFGDTPYTFMGGQDNLPLILLKINSIDPANGAVSVPKTKTITITFNANIVAGPNYANITVKMANGTAKTITKSISGNKLYIKATYGWNPGVKFIVTIPKNAIKNNAGSMLASDFKSTFTAAVAVNFIDPANGAVSVPKTKTIVVTFSNNILAGPDYNKITVKLPDGTAKAITKTISGNKLYIKATYNWNPGVKFTVTIPKNAIKNNAGSMLAADFKSTFTAAS